MFTARIVVLLVVLGAGGVAASSAREVDDAFSVPAGTTATVAVAHPAMAVESTPTSKSAPAVTASTPFARRATAQK